MLALSRKKGESIVIDNNVEITVFEIKGVQIKLGIKAPKSVPVYRKEIFAQIQEENMNAFAGEAGIEALKKMAK